jgi:hypothetical protein
MKDARTPRGNNKQRVKVFGQLTGRKVKTPETKNRTHITPIGARRMRNYHAVFGYSAGFYFNG